MAELTTGFRSIALMLRGRARLTQREVAASIGVSERAVQVWEAGVGHPSAASLQRLLVLYLNRGAFLAGREVAEAAAFWDAAVREAPRLNSLFDSEWFSALVHRSREAALNDSGIGSSAWVAPTRNDWGEAPSVPAFHGRLAEQETLAAWMGSSNCRVVGIVGMGGIGKTALAARVCEELAPRALTDSAPRETGPRCKPSEEVLPTATFAENRLVGRTSGFEAVFWRTLRNAPSCADWLAEAILLLSERRTVPAVTEGEQLRQLVQLIRQRRCLLVLDNFESVLESGVANRAYHDGYAGYGQLLQLLSETAHDSCMLVTSREEPPELGRLEYSSGPVRVLRLGGLDVTAGRALLADKGLVGPPECWQALVRRYSGNALALQVVGELIARVFNCDIAAFLATGEAVFGDIRRLLRAQLQRLSAIERALVDWLAVEREPVDYTTLANAMGPGVAGHELLDALQALDRRSLLEHGEEDSTFTLQPVVLEHVTDEIVSTCAAEIMRGEPSRLLAHPLVKASVEHIRDSQELLIVRPLLERLEAWKQKPAVEQTLIALLDRWRGRPDVEQGFGPGNVVTLLRLSRGTLRGLDLSRLLLRNTYMWRLDARDVNLSNSRLEHVLMAQQFGAAASAHLSADGSCVGIGTLSGEVRLWRVCDHTPVLLERQPTGPVWDLALSADARTIATCDGSGSVWLWSGDGSQLPKRLDADSRELWCVALSRDGRRVIAGAGAGSGIANIWDARNGERLHTMDLGRGGVRGVALSDDGTVVITSCADGTVNVWDVRDALTALDVKHFSGEARAVALSPDGRRAACGDADGRVHVWATRTGELHSVLTGHTGPVWAIAFGAGGESVVSGSADHTVRMWSTRTGECQTLYRHEGGVIHTSVSQDGQLVASAALDGSAHVWETRRGRQLLLGTGNVPAVFDVAISGDGQRAVSGGGDGSLRVWDVASGKSIQNLRGHRGAIWGVALSSDKQFAVSASIDSTLRIWSLRDGRCLKVLTGHPLGTCSVAISPDQQLIASGGFDGELRLWDFNSGRSRAVKQFGIAGVRMVRFSAHGHLLVTCELGGAVQVWDVASLENINTFEANTAEMRAAAISADGRVVASVDAHGKIRIYDACSGERLGGSQAQSSGVRGLALTGDGRHVVTGGCDASVEVWDVDTGQRRHVLHGHAAEVWSVALSADDRLILTGSMDGTMRLWDLEDGVELTTMRPDRPFERMDITGVTGISEVQRMALFELGAVAD